MKIRGYLCILTAATLWGLIGPVSRLVFNEGITPLETAFWRAVMAWFVFLLHAVATGQMKVNPGDLPRLIFFGLIGVTVFYGANLTAVSRGGAALASVLLYTAPAWVAVLSRIFFRESVTAVKLIALVLTLVGVAGVSLGAGSIGLSGEKVNLYAVIPGLVSGFSYSLYYIFGKYFSDRYSAPTLFAYILPVGAAGLFPFVEFGTKSPAAWTGLLFIAFFATYGAYFFYYTGLKYIEPTRAVVTATLEPVIAAAVAWVWWGEYFKPAGYAGAALILAGVLIMIRDDSR